jgi:hypothetical protein
MARRGLHYGWVVVATTFRLGTGLTALVLAATVSTRWFNARGAVAHQRVISQTSFYDGFTALMALVNPHPALRAAVPINAMVGGWRGDDWFHNGAFRLDSLTYFHDQEATRGSDLAWWTDHYDEYDAC